MRMYKDLDSLRKSVKGFLEVTPQGVNVVDEAMFKTSWTDTLVHTAVFGATEELKGTARFFLKGLANAAGIHLASIQGLYEAVGRGEAGGFTVPAMNIRGLSYDTARAFFRAANKLDCSAFIFEIAKTEMGYTSQPAHEYVAVMIGAALREGYRGPLCIQGDHFQASAKSYFEDPEKEISGLKSLITEAMDGGFYNIDIDSSTLVVLERTSQADQQRDNARVCGALTAFIREHQPEGIEVSVGGEIGEVGGHNSTVEEFRAFFEAYRREIPSNIKGISKISVQTGTSHGGVPLPDGSIAEVNLDFDVLSSITKVSREEFGLGGTVQHGASTLPDEAFNQFPKNGACEVHLATGFQNIVYDHPAMPAEFREKVYEHIRSAYAS